MKCQDSEEQIAFFFGTREAYEYYLRKRHLTEEDVYLVEEVDELDFSS